MTTDTPTPITPRDLFLARDLSDSEAKGYLAERGFRQPAEADTHLQQLADDLSTRLALGELADVLLDTLLDAPDPDAALVGFCRYVATRIPRARSSATYRTTHARCRSSRVYSGPRRFSARS